MVVFILLALGFVFLAILLMRDIGFWVNAQLSNAPVSFFQILSLRFRNIPTDEIVQSAIMLNKIGEPVSAESLVAHSEAGGDVKKVAKALVLARQNNVDLTFQSAADKDLKGKDVIAEVNAQIDKK